MKNLTVTLKVNQNNNTGENFFSLQTQHTNCFSNTVGNTLSNKIESMLEEIFIGLNFVENDEMKMIKNELLKNKSNFDELFEQYKKAEQNNTSKKSGLELCKTQIGVLLTRVFCLYKIGKIDYISKQFKDIDTYLILIPDIDECYSLIIEFQEAILSSKIS